MIFDLFKKKEKEADLREGFKKRPVKDGEFKDLKPENKRARKTPAKPWGKKERLLILILLLLTAGTSSVLGISSRAWKLPGLPRFKLPLMGSQTIIIEGDANSSEEENNLLKQREVIQYFDSFTKDLSGVYGLYVIRLDDGSSYGVNQNETFQPASLNKLPVMATIYKESESNNLYLETKYTLKQNDKTSGSGSLATRPVGTVLTYEDLVRLMGQESDNTAFTISRKILTDEKVQQTTYQLGMRRTSLVKNTTTPYDIGLFFEKLWKAKFLSSSASTRLLEYLTDTSYEEWIRKGIPPQIRVAHKFGRETNVVNDAGIVFSDRPFVLVIMGKGVLPKEANQLFPKLAETVYLIESRQ